LLASELRDLLRFALVEPSAAGDSDVGGDSDDEEPADPPAPEPVFRV